MDLFIRADGSPMEFTGCTRGVDNNVIAEIRQNGGSFNTAKLAALQSKTTAGNHSIICLANRYALLKIPTNTDVFDQDYIRRSVQAGRTLELNDFRINQRSVYAEAYDATEIVWGLKKWSDLTVRPQSEDAVSGIDDDDDDETDVAPKKAAVAMHRMPYSLKEEEKIVQYLIDKRAYNSVKGNRVWKDLESEGRLGRSWQSMKERYVKHVVPKLHRFKCVNEKHMKRFKDAWNGLEVTVTDTDSSPDSGDYVAVDKPKAPSQNKDNECSAKKSLNKKEVVGSAPHAKKSVDSRSSSPPKNTTPMKRGESGLIEKWIRSAAQKTVVDGSKSELTDEHTDAILEVTFGSESGSRGEDSANALDEVLASPPPKSDAVKKYGKVYSAKKATPASRDASPPPANLSREPSPVPGPSWRKSPVKSIPEKSSLDGGRPRRAAPVVVMQRLDMDTLSQDGSLRHPKGGRSRDSSSDSSFKETQPNDDYVEEEEVDAAPSPSEPSASSSEEEEEERGGLDETWKEEMELDPWSYTTQEDKDIVLFLIKTRRYTLVKGTDVWESMSKKLKKPRTWQSLKNRFFRNIAPNLQSYNFGQDICNKIQLGLQPKQTKKKKSVAELFAERNLSPLSSLSEEEEEFDHGSSTRGQKRPALTPPTRQTLPSQSPNKTQREGGFVAKKRKLVNPKEMFEDSPVSNPTQSKPSRVLNRSQQFNSTKNRTEKSQEVEVVSQQPESTVKVKSPTKLIKSPKEPQFMSASSSQDFTSPRKPNSQLRTQHKAPQKPKSPEKLDTTVSRRDPFSQDEDLQILKFIAEAKRYKDVKGNTLWEHMEKKTEVCPGRTSQSMKERFRKRIVPKIDSFVDQGLTPDQIRRFKDYAGPKKK